ncbi:MAG: amidase, partial [Singulisphaera sp.]|nr:amidase [Singulisphaera sp.]
PREFFFDSLDPEVDAAIKITLTVLQQITAGLREAVLPSRPDQQESVYSVFRAEAYAYHFEWVNKSPELYQPETLQRIRSGADVTTRAYIQGRRDLAQARRVFERAFESVDVLVTPTIAAPPPTTADMNKDLESSTRLGAIYYFRNTAPFDVWGNPTISVPCGFTRKGLPIGLQISGPNGGEAAVLQLARAYEQATDWHTRAPSVKPD